MKAMTRSQLARYAGVSQATFKRWMEQIRPEILKVCPDQKQRGLLKPAVVRLIVERFGIDISVPAKKR